MTQMKCIKCSCDDTIEQKVVKKTKTVGGLSFTTEVPVLVCQSCGESYLPNETKRSFDFAVAKELAREGIVNPEAFKFMRKRLRLTAKNLAELLFTTPETISRWENGKCPLDLKAVKLLGAMILVKKDSDLYNYFFPVRIEACDEGAEKVTKTKRMLHAGDFIKEVLNESECIFICPKCDIARKAKNNVDCTCSCGLVFHIYGNWKWLDISDKSCRR
jgi:putative zinc finger/helix-turn-helix YgiT family protein